MPKNALFLQKLKISIRWWMWSQASSFLTLYRVLPNQPWEKNLLPV